MTVKVGVDIGGTKTHILVERDQEVILDRRLPTAEWQRGELTEHPENGAGLLRAIGIDLEPAASIVVGAHGLDSDHQVERFTGWLRAAHLGPLLVLNDVELLGAAAGGGPAISVIAGTGSKVVGRSLDGEVLSAWGHGYLVDDPGSAPALTRDAVRAVVAAADAGEPEDYLGMALRRHFDAVDEVALAASFSAAVHPARWGALAPVVFEAAEAGSALALAVIGAAGDDLARGVATVRTRGAVAEQVVCAGGVLTGQPLLFAALRRGLAAFGVTLPVTLLTADPAIGALALAERLAPSVPID